MHTPNNASLQNTALAAPNLWGQTNQDNAAQAAEKPKARTEFNAWLRRVDNAPLYWNQSDAMLAAFVAGHAEAMSKLHAEGVRAGDPGAWRAQQSRSGATWTVWRWRRNEDFFSGREYLRATGEISDRPTRFRSMAHAHAAIDAQQQEDA